MPVVIPTRESAITIGDALDDLGYAGQIAPITPEDRSFTALSQALQRRD
jgi:hypothetical protein